MRIPQKLIVHTGCAKTGSSALQAYFSANLGLLEESKIGYRHAPRVSRPNEITSGNGSQLYKALSENDGLEMLLGTIKSYCGNDPLSIVSSEHLSFIKGEQWALFLKACESLFIELTFVVFVRDVEAFFLSNYNQGVKRAGLFCDYDTYIKDSQRAYIHLRHVRSLLDIFGADAVKVIRYEEASDSLDLYFWNSIGLSREGFDRSLINTVINRGLVSYELELLRKLNLKTGTEYSTKFSDYLIYARPELNEKKLYRQSFEEVLESMYRKEVDWANAQFFKGNESIKIISDAQLDPPDIPDIPEFLIGAIQCDAFVWLAQQLGRKLINTRRVSSALSLYIDRVVKHKPELITPFFDAAHYLMAYPDVHAAKADPLQHYLNHGALEGRRPCNDMSGFLEALLVVTEDDLK